MKRTLTRITSLALLALVLYGLSRIHHGIHGFGNALTTRTNQHIHACGQ